jgi:hypothetical protein
MKGEVSDDAVVARLGAGEGQTGRLVTDGDISTVAQHRDIRPIGAMASWLGDGPCALAGWICVVRGTAHGLRPAAGS